ncbi:DNA methyltransferase [Maribellus mangrovi]|uniref:DNA methyltransferase n=1 Tax=Maribellus mangrovi TaxID=3133146 RepID=UPI0030EB87BD
MFKQDTNQPITVLGLTFNSEEERREHFRKELRKKLPELKQMEGFPIGEDDDIINLSDPPYYTACPNPWLNDFIVEWEKDKKQLEKEGKRSGHFQIDEPYASDVSEGKNNPVYSAHNYHTKVPHPAIMRYILHYTQPGDIVFDGFAGTGMTGLASSLLACPPVSTRQEIENEFRNNALKLPTWGTRKSICSDLSPIASFIAHNYNKDTAIEILNEIEEKILSEIDSEYGWMYETIDPSTGNKETVDFTVYSDVFECPQCSKRITFYNSCVNHDTGKINREFECPGCSTSLTKRKVANAKETVFDDTLGIPISQNVSVPVLIQYRRKGKALQKKVDKNDLDLINKIAGQQINSWYPNIRMMEGGESRRNDKSGLTHVHHFYSKRALIVLSRAFELCEETSDPNMARFVIEQCVLGMARISRYVPTHFSQVNQYLSGTLYVGSQVVDVSLRYILDGKLKRLKKAFSYFKAGSVISTQDAGDFRNLTNNSIDYIFTDPPFGANLAYSELNFFWEAWEKVITNYNNEAIENSPHGKGKNEYSNLMKTCFSQMFRVLKPGKWMTVEFSNTSAAIWNGIQNAIQGAGFVIANVSSLDKKQGSFKAVTTATAVKQDLVISCYKPSSEFDEKFIENHNKDLAVWDFINEHLQHLPIYIVTEYSTSAIIERSPKILFDRLIAFYVQKGLPVPIDAIKFQQDLREHFIERDGMFFTNEQVQEYDKKKEEAPTFIQLSLLVSSEQDGVYWLKNLLKEKSFTYQDIQPKWMQALAGVRKGDIIPELADILEENFLKNEAGKWYLPDPENEADLEKLRNKRLLKQFDSYKTQATAARTKRIKEVRVDALRVGFKQCYQEKDFNTIVAVADKIPNNLLMEDEVLLQFYDIAAAKV